jgi:hypothetical protein
VLWQPGFACDHEFQCGLPFFLCGHLWDSSQPFAYVSKLSLQLEDHLPLAMSFPVTLEAINEQNRLLFCYFLHHSNH